MKKAAALVAVAALSLGVWMLWLWPFGDEANTSAEDRHGISSETANQPAPPERRARRSALGATPLEAPTPRVDSAGLRVRRNVEEATSLTLVDKFQALELKGSDRTVDEIEDLLVDRINCDSLPMSEVTYSPHRTAVETWPQRRAACDAFTDDLRDTAFGWLKEHADRGEVRARQLYMSIAGFSSLGSLWEVVDPTPAFEEYLQTVGQYLDEEIQSPRRENLAFLADALAAGIVMAPRYQAAFMYRFADDILRHGSVQPNSVRSAGWKLTDNQILAAENSARELLERCCGD